MTEGKTIRPDRLILADNRPLGHGARAATVTRLAVLMGVCIFPVPLGLSLWSWISTGDHRPGAVADNLPVFLGLLSCAFVFASV
jgi:hypothetical protein